MMIFILIVVICHGAEAHQEIRKMTRGKETKEYVPPSLYDTGGISLGLLVLLGVLQLEDAQYTSGVLSEGRKLRIVGFTSCLFLLSFLDSLIVRSSPARWLILHTVGNAIVMITAAKDTVSTIKTPISSLNGSMSSLVPTLMVPALHVYHMIGFKCSTADYVHHVLFAGVICSLGFMYEIGTIQNTIGFFMCGLPGFIDYAMLACVKTKRLSPVTEKVWNARINVWLRSPGLLFCAFCCFYATPPDGFQSHTFILVGILCLLNGQYYMQVVVGNTYLRIKEFGVNYNS